MAGLVLTYNTADVTQYVGYNSITVKLNSLDFTLVDPPDPALTNLRLFMASPGLAAAQPVTLNLGGWDGFVSAVRGYDLVDIVNGHKAFAVTATNSYALAAGSSTFALTDGSVVVAMADDYLLESGSGHYLLESGTFQDPGALQMEGGSYGYSNLAITGQKNLDGTTSVVGTLTMFQPGLWPGSQFNLISSNVFGGTLSNMVVTQVVITFQVSNQPRYEITFGESIADQMQTWSGFIKAQ